MKELTNKELKKIVQETFDMQMGFMPALKDIILLEASGDGTYIRFKISVHEYVFRAFYEIDLGEIFRVTESNDERLL